jgi:putative ABC transport system permease protein
MMLAHGVRPPMARLDLKVIIPPGLIADVLIGAVALCLGASLISFRKIAGLDPAVVLRDRGGRKGLAGRGRAGKDQDH